MQYLQKKDPETPYYEFSYWGVRAHHCAQPSLAEFYTMIDTGKVYFSHSEADADIYVIGEASIESLLHELGKLETQRAVLRSQIGIYREETSQVFMPSRKAILKDLESELQALESRIQMLTATIHAKSAPLCWNCGTQMEPGTPVGMIDREDRQTYECPKCHNAIGQ